VAGHHPLITYGEHGGVYPLSAHIFPLAELSHYLYVPLPVVGSIYPLYRKWFGHLQDTSHPIYREFSEGIMAIMREYPGSVFVAGHEHALQYILKDSSHFIVSGSAAKTEHVRRKKYAVFAEDVRGFGAIELYADGEAVLRFYQADENNLEGREIFSHPIKLHDRPRAPETGMRDFDGQVVEVNASNRYRAGSAKESLLGKNYRDAWAQTVRVPVFDIGAAQGGMRILQRGGGMQTLSIRMEDSTGHEWVLRSVEKYPEKAVPPVLRKTFAQDLVQDQISASHPYAALVVPPLAAAAGIYHTNPQLVYIPDDPRLGDYRKLFANSLALFEERPAGNWSGAESFGRSDKIINTTKVIEKLVDDNDNQVDQKFVLRSRLFDLLIGDWDRHDDQWRWATFGDKKTKMFRPIPRDRDQAFFVNEGKLSKIWSRKWALPKFEGFDERIDWAPGLSFNARYFDRTFLTQLSRVEWIATAQALQEALTDEVIEGAIRRWPLEIFSLHGQRIVSHLKSRRNRLVHDAESLYAFLAREVDVTGSDKREQFEVERQPDGNIDVSVYKLTKEGIKGRLLFKRSFDREETQEVRLYGLGGDDRFDIAGESRNPILVRIIGGQGQDTLKDGSVSAGKPTIFYDQFQHSVLAGKRSVRDRRSRTGEVNDYNRKSFRYDRLAPLIYGNYNPDDGLFAGGGFVFVNHGFRKEPFRQRHIVLAAAAPLTLSYNFRYMARYVALVGKWDLDFDLNLNSPNYVNNFFGLGNETRFDRDIDERPGVTVDDAIDYYRFRFKELRADVSFSRKFLSAWTFRIGPVFQRIQLEEPEAGDPRYISEFASGLEGEVFDVAHSFAGVAWQFGIDKRDNEKFTSRGVVLNVGGRNVTGLSTDANAFNSYESALALYYRFRAPRRLMLAARAGGGLNKGPYAFYQAQVLDGKTELRGFRKTRFYGDARFFSNTEARLTLTRFRTYLFPATMGVLAFHDVGRVWYQDASGLDPSASGRSKTWHRGWGGGVWFTPFNAAVLSLEAGRSKEGTLVYFRLGFLF
ncbi:MAG TPA: BamA/TamA family outer membrane protein, partial [Chryseosolibacter sp.]|nr:BamA/TamA family outer membrane protein [Chryseosolibacter sp.]